jgi:hypothetical protein
MPRLNVLRPYVARLFGDAGREPCGIDHEPLVRTLGNGIDSVVRREEELDSEQKNGEQ